MASPDLKKPLLDMPPSVGCPSLGLAAISSLERRDKAADIIDKHLSPTKAETNAQNSAFSAFRPWLSEPTQNSRTALTLPCKYIKLNFNLHSNNIVSMLISTLFPKMQFFYLFIFAVE